MKFEATDITATNAEILIDGKPIADMGLAVYGFVFSAEMGEASNLVLKCRALDGSRIVADMDMRQVRLEIGGATYRLVEQEEAARAEQALATETVAGPRLV